jgi:hypothetical protein
VEPKKYTTFVADFASIFSLRHAIFELGSWTYENNHYICTPKVEIIVADVAQLARAADL